MNTLKRSLAILLMLLLCVGILAVSAYATETVRDGVEVSLVTDKTAYDKDLHL